MQSTDTKVIKETFQEIADIVTPTMGARGRLAVIQDEFSRPILTDDGVTVAKECLNFKGFKRLVALSMIEAANNTEKAAYDGTTLTLLLTNELYKQGLRWVKRGMHPQQAADLLLDRVNSIREDLQDFKIPLKDDLVYSLANITTKIPLVADLVTEAFHKSKKTMNIMIEHDRVGLEHSVEYTEGMVLYSGYMTESLKQLCNKEDRTEYKNAALVLLAEGSLTQHDVAEFFQSIPEEHLKTPMVFFIPKSFNPESLKMLIDTLVDNQLLFQIVFINDTRPEEVFLDLAAISGGTIQDSTQGSTNYLFSHCGLADTISIEQDKTTILPTKHVVNNTELISNRIKAYRKELSEKKYNTGMNRYTQITERLANLESGVTKIKLALPTVTEFMTLKLKLDDAIGAIQCASKTGVLMGGGKTLFNLATKYPDMSKVLKKPLETIISNAGLKNHKRIKNNAGLGYDVVKKEVVHLINSGIIDSFDSIDVSLKNSVSIASQYLRSYTLIMKS